MTLRPKLITAPGLVVSLAEVKAQSRITWDGDDDQYIETLINAATTHLEGIAGRCFLEQEWTQEFSCFADVMNLPKGDLISISEITYYDADNNLQTASTDIYAGFTDFHGAFVTLKYGASWLSTARRLDAVKVKWKAGFSNEAAQVPTDIKHAIKLLVAHWYVNREAVGEGGYKELPFACRHLMMPHCIMFV